MSSARNAAGLTWSSDGNDVIVGGLDQDTLTGGLGADAFIFSAEFRFNAFNESTRSAPDRITDFSAAQGDYVDLSRIDANFNLIGDQGFNFVSAFTNQAGQATLIYDAATNTTTFSGDADGDGVADFVLLLTGNVGTSAGWVL